MQVVLGPPGTGKTTYLLQQIEEELQRGTRPDRIGLVTFTKKAAEVGRKRAVQRFGLAPDELPWFRTLHSWGFASLGLSRTAVLNTYKEPASQLGLPLRPGDIWPHEKGDRIYHLINLARISRKPLQQVYSHSRPDFPYVELERAHLHLAEYKQATGLVDYTDIIHRYLNEGVPPRLKLLLVDEAQDLSHIQWEMVFMLSSAAERTVIAGDDDQAIYGWAGADTNMLLRIARQHGSHVLEQSYRVPSAVQSAALGIVERIEDRVPKQWHPRKARGHFVRLPEGYMPRFERSGSYMLLARSTYSLIPYAQDLRARGYSYLINDHPSFPPPLERAITLWEDYRRTGNRSKGMARAVRRWMSDTSAERNLYKDAREPWHTALDLVSDRMRLYRQGMLKKQPSIRLSTIHRVKGDEADHVLLLTDLSGTVTDKMKLYGSDEEARVFYVGATRARHTLAVINGEQGAHFHV